MPETTLLAVTGDKGKIRIGWWPSGLMQRVKRSWTTPLPDLSCGQYRMLVGQGFGLEWLARPSALFVQRYPRAECDLYAGDLTTNLLLKWREIARYAPEEMRAVVMLDFEWMVREVNSVTDDHLGREALAALAEARRMLA